ncbi:SitI3 family protein [Micromonospora sp. C51]|uniref:SitI3 family protein n=1 Tax=Micromonospora sp. C51 TaxID=2824879 RepID=UPI0027DDA4BC|nr:SitI3 family protein [Micromonospora sp. C51]
MVLLGSESVLGRGVVDPCRVWRVSLANGYWKAEADGEDRWEWEPAAYVSVTFSMRADDIAEKGIPNMVAAVGRVLAGRDEDAALVQDGNYLVLTRTDGVIRTYRPDWWHHYHLDRSVIG